MNTLKRQCSPFRSASKLVVCSRRHPLRCTASSTAYAAARPKQALVKQDLIQHFIDGCTPREKWVFGTEHEKLGYNLKDGTRASYEQIRELLTKLSVRFGWDPIMEGENIIGVRLDGQSVTLEPGGQFELSGAPLDTLHKTCAEVNSHLYQVRTIAHDLGIGFLGIGMDPKSRTEEVPIMPKQRYQIMRNYMPKKGSLGLDMMFRTCTIQVNIDYESEKDMVEKFRIGLALQPVATALFANSPFRDGKPNGYLSWRSHVWSDTDADRCGTLPWVWEDGFGFERYVDYALDVPMYFVYRDGQYIDVSGQSFKDFMAGKLPGLQGEIPSLADWDNHLSTIFPEVRMKKYILEMRGADGGPWEMICALPALWVGLLYDADTQAEALKLVSSWTEEDHAYLRSEVPRLGLRTPFRDGTIQDLAIWMVEKAKEGLRRRGTGEEVFVERLEKIARSGTTQAEMLLQKYNNEWHQSVMPVYDTLQVGSP